jgi:hypothetical protein
VTAAPSSGCTRGPPAGRPPFRTDRAWYGAPSGRGYTPREPVPACAGASVGCGDPGFRGIAGVCTGWTPLAGPIRLSSTWFLRSTGDAVLKPDTRREAATNRPPRICSWPTNQEHPDARRWASARPSALAASAETPLQVRRRTWLVSLPTHRGGLICDVVLPRAGCRLIVGVRLDLRAL